MLLLWKYPVLISACLTAASLLCSTAWAAVEGESLEQQGDDQGNAEKVADPLVSGVSATEIRFGQIAALKGPNEYLGRGLQEGLLAAFAEVNESGGIQGRKLSLIAANDSYEPDLSLLAASDMLAVDEVFALIGGSGTATAQVLERLTAEQGVPFIAPLTGASFLRDPERTQVINLRASYHQEAEAIISHLYSLNIRRIAVFYQEDLFGKTGLEGVRLAQKKRADMTIVSRSAYPRNTTIVKTGLLDILLGSTSAPEAVVIVGATEPAALFIKWAWHINLNPTFVSLSFVNSDDLAARLRDREFLSQVLVSQVIPPHWDESIPVVARYRKALARYRPEAKPNFNSLEGYLSAALTIRALQHLDSPPTRAAFLDFFKTENKIDLGGFELNYGPQDNQGSNQVSITAITADGQQQAISKSDGPPQ